MNSPAFDLHAPFPAFPADTDPAFIHDDLAYPLFASHADLGHPYPADYEPLMPTWSPDAKKQLQAHPPHVFQIPRSQNLYPHAAYHDVKLTASFVAAPAPPVQREVQQQQQHAMHSPHSGHQLQHHQLAAPAPVFNLDEEWQQQQQQQAPPSVHYTSQGHLAAYPNSSSSPSDPPRIKQEELSAFPAMHGYSDSQLLHQQHQRNSMPASYEPLNLPMNPQSHPHDPNHNLASFQTMLSPIQTHQAVSSPHSHPQPQSAPAYYSSFHHPSPQQLQGTPATQQQQHHHVHQPAPRQPHSHDARSFPPFSGGGTVHPAELSPSTESCTSVSPLSTYADLSAGVVGAGCDPRFVCQSQQQVDMKNSLGWRDDRRGSLASIHSDLSVHSHGMVEIEMGMDGMEGLGVNMAGVVAGGMPMEIHEAVGGDEDAAGEEDAEGDEDWEQSPPHGSQQFQVEELQYLDHQGHDGMRGQMQRDEEHTMQARPAAADEDVKRMSDDEGEDEVATESEGGVEAEGEREIEAEPEYDSELSESESEDDDDPDDPEFVPRSRRRAPLRRQSTYPAAGGNESTSAPYHTFAYSSLVSEGRTLRPRSSSARYTPYPGSYPETSFYSEEQDYDQQDAQSNGSGAYSDRKRATSTSSVTSSSTQPPRSTSSLSGSSGITTTTTTARRRLRPSNTLPVPIPVPNLTKKSRGRRVPTMSSLEDLRSAASGAGKKRQTAGKTARMYLCDVEGCGKCFARGEHLKRHVRSIHTYEKPHKCLYPGCGKDFSRHDNLGQHMRVHKDYVQEGVTVAGSTRRSTSASSRRKAQTQN